MTSTKSAFIPVIEEDLNREHNVTLKEGQISTILYVLEGYIAGNFGNYSDITFKEDVDNIFERLEGAIDTFYKDNSDPLNVKFPGVDYPNLTPLEEELEIQKYIRDNPN